MANPTSETFPRRLRIVRPAEFRAIYGTGVKLHCERCVLFGRSNSLGHHRLGITVSRKVGGAVVRNRVKRLFREIFRKSTGEVPHHFDFIVNAKRAAAAAAYSELREEFLAAARRICG